MAIRARSSTRNHPTEITLLSPTLGRACSPVSRQARQARVLLSLTTLDFPAFPNKASDIRLPPKTNEEVAKPELMTA